MYGRMHSGKISCVIFLIHFIVMVLFFFHHFDDLLALCCNYSYTRAADHKWDDNQFATAGAQLDIWDHSRLM